MGVGYGSLIDKIRNAKFYENFKWLYIDEFSTDFKNKGMYEYQNDE